MGWPTNHVPVELGAGVVTVNLPGHLRIISDLHGSQEAFVSVYCVRQLQPSVHVSVGGCVREREEGRERERERGREGEGEREKRGIAGDGTSLGRGRTFVT